MDINLDLTDEQKAQIEEVLYKAANYNVTKDEDNFVIPFIAMNDGVTPAQIRTSSRGLYKDIQRSPFLRKTGVFDSKNTIPDIDISSLVYYGTLEQSKIAPTLENVDIKLYFREPKLTKVPDNDGNSTTDSYADNYIWRELPSGFHTYNNDIVYGYEWLVLQSDYVNTNGIYNLHMNIEDGLGCCKFAGTQAPINLAGVQYKIVITAKNLWNREYSLIDSMPLVHNLGANSDELAPTVNAVREYYKNALDTLKVTTEALYVGNDDDFILTATKDGVVIKALTLGEIENLENYVTTLNTDFYNHIKEAIDGATYDSNGNLIGVHGIINKGRIGNIAASTLDGLTLSNGQQSVVEDVTGKYAYIPFVDNNNVIGLGSTINFYNRSGNEDPSIYLKKSLNKQTSTKTLIISNVSGQSDLTDILETVSVGTTILNARIATVNNEVVLKLTSGSTENGNVTLSTDKLNTNLITLAGETINAANVAVWKGSSSVAYKKPYSELLNIKIKDVGYKTLTPNTPTDADGNKVTNVDFSKLDDEFLRVPKSESEKDINADINTFDKLGSALQALYELPLGTFKYKRGQDEYKTQIGIFVERVNQIRDKLETLKGSGFNKTTGVANTDNYLVHKRNTLLKSSNTKIRNYNSGADASQDRKDSNVYTYTDEEIKSIKHYLDLTTSKKELAQEIRNTVGILLIAAKETQERLLDIETAVYGFDAKTVPGEDTAKSNWVNDHIEKDLQSQITNNPLLLGLNRLMRALCLEIFDTTDLEKIDAEYESRLTDSDTLGAKVSVKSRMDQIDEITSSAANQLSALVKYYIENITNDENNHSYVDIYQKDDQVQRITSKAALSEDTSLLNNLADDHGETKDIDHGRTWKNLPGTTDVTDSSKNAVGFAKIATSAHKHTPTKEESGIVRVPITEDVKRTDISETKKDSEVTENTVRSWTFFKLDSTQDDENYYSKGTYNPWFKTKAVAWNSAKLERINKKLSEVTKTIYGVDDVTASLPNRTEVLRRNITNIIDDLYPNRLFKIENPVTVSNGLINETLYYPFKNSKIQNPIDTKTAVTKTTDENTITSHTSLITWFDNEIFNFTIKNNYVANNGAVIDSIATVNDKNNTSKTHVILKSSTSEPFSTNKQIALASNQINFNTSKLISDTVNSNTTSYGTYQHAYSRIDMLEDLIGVSDCYIGNIYSSNILDAFGINKSNATLLDYLPSTNSLAELAKEISESLAKYTNENDVTGLYSYTTKDSYTTTANKTVSQENVRYTSNHPTTSYTVTTSSKNSTTDEIEYSQKDYTYNVTQSKGTGSLDILRRALNAEQSKLFDTQKEKNNKEWELSCLNDKLTKNQKLLSDTTTAKNVKQTAVNNAQTTATTAYTNEGIASTELYNTSVSISKLEGTTLPANITSVKTNLSNLESKITAYNTAVSNQKTAQSAYDTLAANKTLDRDTAKANYESSTNSSTGEQYCRNNNTDCKSTYDYWQTASQTTTKNKVLNYEPLLAWYSYILWYLKNNTQSIWISTNTVHNNIPLKYDDNNYLNIDIYGTRNWNYINSSHPQYGTYYYFDYLATVDGKINGTTITQVLTYAGNQKTNEYLYQQKDKSSSTFNLGTIDTWVKGTTLVNTVNSARNSVISTINTLLSTYYKNGQKTTSNTYTTPNIDTLDDNSNTYYARREFNNITDQNGTIKNQWSKKLNTWAQNEKDYYTAALTSYRSSLKTTWDNAEIALNNAINSSKEKSTLKTCKTQTTTATNNLQTAATNYNNALNLLITNARDLNTLTGTTGTTSYFEIQDSKNITTYYTPITTTTNIYDSSNTSKLVSSPYNRYKKSDGLNTYIDSQLPTVNGGTLATKNTALENARKTHDNAETNLTTLTGELNKLIATELDYKTVVIPRLKVQITDLQNDIYSIENSIDLIEDSIDNLKEQINAYTVIVNSIKSRLATIQSISNDTKYSNGNDLIPTYSKELDFENFVGKNEETKVETSASYDDVLAPNILISSNVGFILSRKQKTLQERITTLEAYADELSKGFNYINNSTLYTNVKSSDLKKTNRRFEALDAFDTLSYIGETIATSDKNPMIFDLDLSESYSNNNKSLYKHNVNLWQIISHSDDVKKTNYSTTGTTPILGFYQITGTLRVPLERIPFYVDAEGDVNKDEVKDIEDIKSYFSTFTVDTEWTINIKYVSHGTDASTLTEKSTIYLLGKTPTSNYLNFFSNNETKTASSLLNGANGWQNQTEYNIYKTINNLFNSLLTNNNKDRSGNNLYYQLMRLEHPIGSIYLSLNTTNPSELFGGTWVQITKGYLLPSEKPTAVVGNTTVTPSAATSFVTSVSNYGSDGKLLTGCTGNLTVESITVNNTYNESVINKIDSVTVGASDNYQVSVTAKGTSTLEIDNIPHINVCVWTRVN